MRKGQNYNRPKKGSKIKVEPIKNKKDIETIKKLLSGKPRDFALFSVGINTNLRAVDLLRINAGMVRGLKPMDEIEIKEKKTGKLRRVSLNQACIKAIQKLLASRAYRDTDPLFIGRSGKALTVPSVTRLVKSWCAAINLRGNFGAHTLRKTFGYANTPTTSGPLASEIVLQWSKSLHYSLKLTPFFMGFRKLPFSTYMPIIAKKRGNIKKPV